MSELPRGWATARLSDLGGWIGGGTPSKANPAFWSGDIPWVSPKDMKVEVINDAEDHITGEALANSATNLVPDNSVLVVTRSGILRHSLPVAVTGRPVSLNQDLKALTPHRGLHPHYIAWALRAHAQRILRNCAKGGTTVQSVETNQLLQFEIPIAPTAEQARIVAAIEEQFSRLDAGVATLERVHQKLERMRDAVLSRATVLEGYTKVVFGEVLREPLRNGHSAKADPSGTVPVLTLTAVTRGDFSQSNMKMTAADPLKVRDLWIQPGDLFIERSNTPELVGTARLYRGPGDAAVYPDLIIRARVNEDVLPEFGELVLRSPVSRRYFRECAQGISGTMPKIDQGAIERLPFPLPPREVQAALVAGAVQSLTLLDDLGAKLATSRQRAASLRSSLLGAAFSGTLVAQDPYDEPASAVLDGIAAERASSDEHISDRTRQRRRKATA
jgi:type I restriction enzyme, S subunit